MPHIKHVVFSYDQEGTEKYEGDFRVDLIKALLTVKNVDTNSFEWWVATTFTFTIKDETSDKTPFDDIIGALEKSNLKPCLNYHIARLRNFNDKTPVQQNQSNKESQENFQNDVTNAKNKLKEEKELK